MESQAARPPTQSGIANLRSNFSAVKAQVGKTKTANSASSTKAICAKLRRCCAGLSSFLATAWAKAGLSIKRCLRMFLAVERLAAS